MEKLINIEYIGIKNSQVVFEIAGDSRFNILKHSCICIVVEHNLNVTKEDIVNALIPPSYESEYKVVVDGNITDKYINAELNKLNGDANLYKNSKDCSIFIGPEPIYLDYSSIIDEGRVITVVCCPSRGIDGNTFINSDASNTSIYQDLNITKVDLCEYVKSSDTLKIDYIKYNINKRCLNCLNNNTKFCTLPKEFISDVILLDVIDAAESANNTYILDNIIDKFSNIYPYEQCKSKCQLCQQNIS